MTLPNTSWNSCLLEVRKQGNLVNWYKARGVFPQSLNSVLSLYMIPTHLTQNKILEWRISLRLLTFLPSFKCDLSIHIKSRQWKKKWLSQGNPALEFLNCLKFRDHRGKMVKGNEKLIFWIKLKSHLCLLSFPL